MNSPLQPLTKEEVARILSVSKRTIENWIADGSLIAPTTIGRRVYWHPTAFYEWLNQRFEHQLAGCRVNEPPAARPPRRGRPRASGT